MPLQRRLPKRGFTNIFKKRFEILNLSRLASIEHKGPLTPEIMKQKGLINKLGFVKVLGNGDLKEALTIHAHKFSQSALGKIEKSGGKAIVIK